MEFNCKDFKSINLIWITKNDRFINLVSVGRNEPKKL